MVFNIMAIILICEHPSVFGMERLAMKKWAVIALQSKYFNIYVASQQVRTTRRVKTRFTRSWTWQNMPGGTSGGAGCSGTTPARLLRSIPWPRSWWWEGWPDGKAVCSRGFAKSDKKMVNKCCTKCLHTCRTHTQVRRVPLPEGREDRCYCCWRRVPSFTGTSHPRLHFCNMAHFANFID